MARAPKKWNVNPLTHNTQIAKPDGTPEPFFIQQWNLLLELVKQFTTDNALLERLAAVEIDTTAPIGGGGPILSLQPIDHDASGATPGTYGDASNVPQITVDEFGHITDVVDVPIAGGNAWSLVASRDFATTPAAVFDASVAGYSEVIVIARNVTSLSAGNRILRVSVDNGTSYYAASGDYIQFSTLGGETNNTGFGFGTTASAAVRSGSLYMPDIESSGQKLAISNQNSAVFAASNSPITNVRYTDTLGNTLTAGQVYVLAR